MNFEIPHPVSWHMDCNMDRSADSCVVTYERVKLFVLWQPTRMAINIFLYYLMDILNLKRMVDGLQIL